MSASETSVVQQQQQQEEVCCHSSSAGNQNDYRRHLHIHAMYPVMEFQSHKNFFQVKKLQLLNKVQNLTTKATAKTTRLSSPPQTKKLLGETFVLKLYPAIVPLGVLVPSPVLLKNKKQTLTSASVEETMLLHTPSSLSSSCVVKYTPSEEYVRFENEVRNALHVKNQFQMTTEGCGGAYFLKNEKNQSVIGIFKPRDEEFMAPKNPRGYVKENAIIGQTEHPIQRGFLIGNGAIRERAVYLLDEAYGHFSNVPVTILMQLEINDEIKEGSMQRFVQSECSAEDMGTRKFSIPQVHKIGILDVRLFNTDRHAGNILLHRTSNQQEPFDMIPIDHGFCMPSFKHLDNATFDWLHWPQASFPFSCQDLEKIESFDIEKDAQLLRGLQMEEECITTMRICTLMLQIGAKAGFSLFEIGSKLQREGDCSIPSCLENLVAKACEKIVFSSEEKDGLKYYDTVVKEVKNGIIQLFEDEPKKKVRSISCVT